MKEKYEITAVEGYFSEKKHVRGARKLLKFNGFERKKTFFTFPLTETYFKESTNTSATIKSSGILPSSYRVVTINMEFPSPPRDTKLENSLLRWEWEQPLDLLDL